MTESKRRKRAEKYFRAGAVLAGLAVSLDAIFDGERDIYFDRRSAVAY